MVWRSIWPGELVWNSDVISEFASFDVYSLVLEQNKRHRFRREVVKMGGVGEGERAS